ncbi:PIR protein [Plasmodium yoelii]|uniref:PIR protein n=2 Tax=Plasmodium yoelii TaxID=5861 RepID=A0AAE9WLV0_PLAYO|nr:PIR protein [Plasmodium yoelii]WBY54920.1 PIR protein [Plasmodium yoelii yoelii]CDU16196.1 YIR protein [Plasmodium yoelii]VTZ72350.1 PIR protein [Plasmodium yoelii]|eukprot:XP_022811418.1 PIR protein [Plasmodium yoelii]
MDYRLCGRFNTLRGFYPDELGKSTTLKFHDNGRIRDYCPNDGSEKNECKTDLDKIKALFLWLFKQNIISRICSLSTDQPKVFIIYIIIWLKFKLNQISHHNITEIKDYYNNYIENSKDYTNCNEHDNDCCSTLKDQLGHDTFKDFIKENEYFMDMDMGMDNISNFYYAFKSLCNMHTECNSQNPDLVNFSKYVKEFGEKYEKLNNDSNNTDGSSHRQILSILSNDYDSFKTKYKDAQCCKSSSLPTIGNKKIIVKGSGETLVHNSEETHAQNSEAIPQSPSIGNKLFIVLSIFAAIPIFLGIAYKYSLFGFRKRTKKQHLREKLKK